MDVLRQTLSVLLVFALLGTALWLLRGGGARFARKISWKKFPAHAKRIVPIERLALTPQHTLHVLRVNGKELIVATHPNGCSIINGAAIVEEHRTASTGA